jgi:hypothetical protein
MRVAHLILAHKNPAQLERLIDALAHPSFDIHIHLDKKTDITPFGYLAEKHNVFLIADRAPVYWAGYGTIQATINGFRAILLNPSYDYINVISAQDFPLASAENIYRYFAENQGAEFITCESIEDQWRSAASRVTRYHLINWRVPGKFRLEKWVNRFLKPRKFPLEGFKMVGRSNWFTLTRGAVTYFLDFIGRHPEVVRFFRYVWGADEFIFATVLYNSPFRDNIRESLVYVDWRGQTQGHPRVLTSKDLPEMLASGKLFARKVDMAVDGTLFDLLEEKIAQHSGSTFPEQPSPPTLPSP